MIKKWVIAAVAYLFVVMVGYGVYSVTVEPGGEPMKMQQEEHGE